MLGCCVCDQVLSPCCWRAGRGQVSDITMDFWEAHILLSPLQSEMSMKLLHGSFDSLYMGVGSPELLLKVCSTLSDAIQVFWCSQFGKLNGGRFEVAVKLVLEHGEGIVYYLGMNYSMFCRRGHGVLRCVHDLPIWESNCCKSDVFCTLGSNNILCVEASRWHIEKKRSDESWYCYGLHLITGDSSFATKFPTSRNPAISLSHRANVEFPRKYNLTHWKCAIGGNVQHALNCCPKLDAQMD